MSPTRSPSSPVPAPASAASTRPELALENAGATPAAPAGAAGAAPAADPAGAAAAAPAAHGGAAADVVSGSRSVTAAQASTPRLSKRLQKRKATADARSADRRKKLARPDRSPSVPSSTPTAVPPAAPSAGATPLPRVQAPGKRKVGSAARVASLVIDTSTARATPSLAELLEKSGGSSTQTKPRASASKKKKQAAHVATASTAPPQRHSIIYLDSPPPRDDDADLTTGGTSAPPFAASQQGGQGSPRDDHAQGDHDNFNLASFLDGPSSAATAPGRIEHRSSLAASAPASHTEVAQVAAQVGSLSALVLDLRAQLASARSLPSLGTTPSSTPTVTTNSQPILFDSATSSTWTVPTTSGELPPVQLRELRCSSFPSAVNNRGRGDNNPHSTHILAAYRSIQNLSQSNGMYTPPTDTVIAFRNAASLIPFDVSNATATGLYGVRIGSQGLSIRHFTPLSANERLVRSSSNANFSIDFSSVTAPAEPPTTCPSYDVILLALSGLSAFGSAFWYPHMISLLDRLRRFVTDNQAADPNNFPDRVTLTLQYANVYLGRAAGHLAMDTPTWWCDFRAATAAIEYKSLEWLPAFQSLPTTGSANLASQSVPAPPRRPSSTRPPTMLGHLRQQIPRRSDGPEPCLRFFGGDMCFGGSRDKCAYSHRTHRWDSPLPRELQAYINRQYGSNRRGHYGPRRN